MIHVVLYQPEIPQNTGNIMRTCAATNTQLHLIKPLGFALDEKSVRLNQENEDIYLFFGRESTGIPKDILRPHLETCLRLPMVENARSLNLSNTVAILVYEVLRQLDYPGLSKVEVIKGEDWLEHD